MFSKGDEQLVDGDIIVWREDRLKGDHRLLRCPCQNISPRIRNTLPPPPCLVAVSFTPADVAAD
jgi:hypothetical protein